VFKVGTFVKPCRDDINHDFLGIITRKTGDGDQRYVKVYWLNSGVSCNELYEHLEIVSA